ncbi:MAG: sugar ABC transporter ATP-binding protein [Firmicutes bacterium]|nr:sugar ABC transporter ATP-binding protein [Bacillota bacterium]
MPTRMLEVHGICKAFPGVQALNDINLHVYENEIVGLIGENGAGKSTFLNILSGICTADRGGVRFLGKAFKPANYREATLAGVSRVYQEQALVPNIPVFENILLSHEELFTRYGFMLDKKSMIAKTREELKSLGCNIDPAAPTERYDFSVRQIIEIAKACSLSKLLGIEKPLILLDEPTSALTSEQIRVFFDIIRSLKSKGSFIFVSHRLTELLELSDRIYVFKDGQVVAMIDDPQTCDEATLHKLMVGRERDEDYYKEYEQLPPGDEVVLRVENFTRKGCFSDINLELKQGEILGIGGVLGSGKSELGRAIAGVQTRDAGSLYLRGELVSDSSFTKQIERGIGYIPAERNLEGIICDFSVAWNISLAGIKDVFGKVFGLLNVAKERAEAENYVAELGIKTPSINALCLGLSGGNQQKVLLSKWLCRNPSILILDNPTRGVDAGAKEEIYGLLRQLVSRQNMSIILISDDLLELIGMSNRIIVMKDGLIKKEVSAAVGAKPSEVELVSFMV